MKKIFTNDKFFLTAVVIAIIGTIYSGIFNVIYYPESINLIAMDLLRVFCVVVLYSTYKKHSKNVMKGMMGALLMELLIDNILGPSFNSYGTAIETVLAVLAVVFSALLFANHFVINSERQSRPVNILINQILCLLCAICGIGLALMLIVYEFPLALRIADFVYAVSFSCTMIVVVCVESRLDAYRQDREASGWTEEKGYPEGYVHEYEKKDKE